MESEKLSEHLFARCHAGFGGEQSLSKNYDQVPSTHQEYGDEHDQFSSLLLQLFFFLY
jgi:hypothetical protein